MKELEMIRNSTPICCLLITCFISACDTPPDEFIQGDMTTSTDSEFPEDTATEEPTETDTGNPPAQLECFEAMICIAVTPESTTECLEGLEEGDREAAADLAICLVKECRESMTSDFVTLIGCLAMSCPDESLQCVGYSLFK